jgi:serine/threonine-protein kinase
MIGEALGNYRLVAQLGSGSMGVVFLAEHQRLERRVAIKLLAPELVRDQQVLQRFFNEARATSSIRHPGIVDVFDCDVDASGRAYMVLEHLEGETLAARLLRTEQLHWATACVIAGQVADALGAVHDKGIVHRDLKPANVFLVGDARDPAAVAVKVLDFGVAKLLAVDAAARLTMRGMLVGTPEYMAPEQCWGSDVDHRADIYALGCILFEMLTGLPPFVAEDVQELIVAHRFTPAPSVATSAADVPVWLDHLLARMLEKDPGRRPASMREVAGALRERKTPGLAAALTLAGRAVMEVAVERGASPAVVPPSSDRSAAPVAPRARGRGRGWVKAAIALAAVFVVAGAVWAARGRTAVHQTSVKSPPSAATGEPAPPTPRRAASAHVGPLPAAATPSRPAADTDHLPLGRRPDRAARPASGARPAVIHRRRVVETDGIVDL